MNLNHIESPAVTEEPEEECKAAEEVKPKPKPKKVKVSEIQLLKDEVAFLKKGMMLLAHMTGNEPWMREIGATDKDMYRVKQKG